MMRPGTGPASRGSLMPCLMTVPLRASMTCGNHARALSRRAAALMAQGLAWRKRLASSSPFSVSVLLRAPTTCRKHLET